MPVWCMLLRAGETCKLLKYLRIPGGSFSSDGLRLGDGCHLLEDLNLSNKEWIIDDTLKSIGANCSGSHSIRIDDCISITDSGVCALSACQSLHLIGLDSCRTTDQSLLALAAVRGLPIVMVNHCLALTDIGVCALARGCDLTHLEMQHNTNITDESLSAIAKYCPYISYVNVRYCPKIADVGVAELMLAAPTVDLFPPARNLKGDSSGHNNVLSQSLQKLPINLLLTQNNPHRQLMFLAP
jgi:hypothetical protein